MLHWFRSLLFIYLIWAFVIVVFSVFILYLLYIDDLQKRINKLFSVNKDQPEVPKGYD